MAFEIIKLTYLLTKTCRHICAASELKYKSKTRGHSPPLYRATEWHSNRLIKSAAAASMVEHASTHWN